MSYSYCKDRRLFLSQLSQSVGLYTAAQLFGHNVFAQAAKPRKNVIFIYFYHSGNIPVSNKGFSKGTFHFGNGSSIKNFDSIKDDAYFVRGVEGGIPGPGGLHLRNSASVFTGHSSRKGSDQLNNLNSNDPDSGTSIDLLIGRHLKNKYKNTKISNSLLANGLIQADTQGNTPYKWKTASFRRSGNKTTAVIPEVNPNTLYNSMKNIINCDSGGTSPQPTDNTALVKKLEHDNKKLNVIKENLSDFKSKYLMPEKEYDKLESDIAAKIEKNQRDLASVANGGTIEVVSCGPIPKPAAGDYRIRKEDYKGVYKRSNAFFEMMAYGLKHDYTRTFTYYMNDWSPTYKPKVDGLGSHHGGGGHGPINNPKVLQYHEEVANMLNNLVTKLKKYKVYEDTMIVIAGQFPHQRGGLAGHRSDNMPWLIVNSGKSGEFNTGKELHVSDMHCAIMNRVGLMKTEFGDASHKVNGKRRRGNNQTKILG